MSRPLLLKPSRALLPGACSGDLHRSSNNAESDIAHKKNVCDYGSSFSPRCQVWSRRRHHRRRRHINGASIIATNVSLKYSDDHHHATVSPFPLGRNASRKENARDISIKRQALQKNKYTSHVPTTGLKSCCCCCFSSSDWLPS